jgi:hypothetical protein
VTGSSWEENYNCISTAEWNGTKYAAILGGVFYNYTDTKLFLLNVDNPASAELVYKHVGTYDITRNDDWSNAWFTGLGTYSDVLLVPAGDTMLMVYVDSNFGSLTCIAIN